MVLFPMRMPAMMRKLTSLRRSKPNIGVLTMLPKDSCRIGGAAASGAAMELERAHLWLYATRKACMSLVRKGLWAFPGLVRWPTSAKILRMRSGAKLARCLGIYLVLLAAAAGAVGVVASLGGPALWSFPLLVGLVVEAW